MSHKVIKTSDINASVGMRFKSGHITWPQSGTSETFDDLLLNLYPDLYTTTVANILWGAVNSGSGANYIISAGAAVVPSLFTFAKVRIPATTFTAAIGAVCVLVTTYPSVSSAGDPTTFSDGSTHDTLQLTELHVVDGNASTPGYVCDYSAVVFLNGAWKTVGATGQPAFANSWVNYGGANQVMQFRKIGKKVYARGVLKDGTFSATVFTLPSGFRPLSQQVFPGSNGGYTAQGASYIQVDTSGNVKVVESTGNNSVVPVYFEFFVD